MGKEAHSEEDKALVRRCQAGEELAFEELVRKYQQTVFNVVHHNLGYRNEIEDVAQKIFSKIYFSLPKFDNNRPFFPWLYRIAINQCYDELRRARRHKVLTFTDLNLEEADSIERLVSQSEIAPQPVDDNHEMHALLHRVLNQLPDQQRTVLVLRDLEDIPYDRMAQILQCSEQAARLKVFRARARMREMLEKAMRRRDRSRVRS